MHEYTLEIFFQTERLFVDEKVKIKIKDRNYISLKCVKYSYNVNIQSKHVFTDYLPRDNQIK